MVTRDVFQLELEKRGVVQAETNPVTGGVSFSASGRRAFTPQMRAKSSHGFFNGQIALGATGDTTWASAQTGWGEFDYVQQVFAVSNGATSFTIDDQSAAPSNAVGVHPSGGAAAWSNPVGQQVFSVQANSASNPAIALGQVIGCRSIARADGSPFPVAAIRNFYATGNTTGPYQGGFTSSNSCIFDADWPAVGGGHGFASGSYSGLNACASPASWTSGADHGATFFPINSGLLFHYRKRHKSVIAIGDSIMQGAAGSIDYLGNYAFRACVQLALEGNRVSYQNFGISGERASSFQTRAKAIIDTMKPDVIVIPSLTINGFSASKTSVSSRADFEQNSAVYFDVLDYATARGVVVVMAAPYPNNGFGAEQNLYRLEARDRVLAAGASKLCVALDFDQFAAADGKWATGFGTDDGTHPNKAGHAAMSAVAKSAINLAI